MREDETYTCAVCGETYFNGWTEEEAEAEFNERFPGEDISKGAIICDDCDKAVMAWLATQRTQGTGSGSI